MGDEGIAEVFVRIAELALALGACDLKALPGCWEHDVDGTWWIALNGRATPTTCSRGATVAAFTAYVEFNGWPAGLVDPGGGVIAAGAAANEGMLIEALLAATKRAGADSAERPRGAEEE